MPFFCYISKETEAKRGGGTCLPAPSDWSPLLCSPCCGPGGFSHPGAHLSPCSAGCVPAPSSTCSAEGVSRMLTAHHCPSSSCQSFLLPRGPFWRPRNRRTDLRALHAHAPSAARCPCSPLPVPCPDTPTAPALPSSQSGALWSLVRLPLPWPVSQRSRNLSTGLAKKSVRFFP